MEDEDLTKELAALPKRVQAIGGTTLISAVKVMVQVKYTRTRYKELTICFQFPDEYPRKPVIMELKSKVMSDKLIDGLAKVCDQEAKKLVGQQQIIPMVNFVKKFVDENPLCVCSEEIGAIKKKSLSDKDEIKLKQKTSQVVLKLKEGPYYLNARLNVPDDYPTGRLGVEISDQNFPETLRINFNTQAEEICRRCIEPPLKPRPKAPPFEPKPALQPVAEYLINNIIRKYPNEKCHLCGKPSLPPDPKDVTNDGLNPNYVIRIYCAHLYHVSCLQAFMKTPPFTGGKKCVECGTRIFHEKFKVPPELAEARWAQQEARKRELDEVVDFLQ